MLRRIKRSFYKKKLKNLEIKHNRLLKEANSLNNHNHSHESEDLFHEIHTLEKRIEHLKDKING